MGILTKEEVQNFLEQFHAKLKVFGIIYLYLKSVNWLCIEKLLCALFNWLIL